DYYCQTYDSTLSGSYIF
nr:immunoglobulin light chain junction region [Macaca mulatta]MOX13010.1 immunoglobulin light chain junction region [Macaca mulatta]MOX13663.1 immunoglobulin light chain junction region [Macaca mulatta]